MLTEANAMGIFRVVRKALKRAVPVVGVSLLLLLFVVCNQQGANRADKAEELDLDEPVVNINGRDINARTFYDYIKHNFGNEEAELDDYIRSRLLDFFIEEQLLVDQAQKMMVTVSETEVERAMGQPEGAVGLLMDTGGWKVGFRNNILVQKFINQFVLRDLVITEEELKLYYDSHPEEFTLPEKVRASQILAEDEEKAEKVLQLLKSRSFEEVARAYSISPEAEKGGDMGYFEKGQLPLEFEKVIFGLKVREYSPVVKSPYGFHVFKLVEKRGEGKLPFKEAVNLIKIKLMQTKGEELYKKYLSQLKAKSHTKIYYQNLGFQYKKKESDKEGDR